MAQRKGPDNHHDDRDSPAAHPPWHSRQMCRGFLMGSMVSYVVHESVNPVNVGLWWGQMWKVALKQLVERLKIGEGLEPAVVDRPCN